MTLPRRILELLNSLAHLQPDTKDRHESTYLYQVGGLRAFRPLDNLEFN